MIQKSINKDGKGIDSFGQYLLIKNYSDIIKSLIKDIQI